MSEADIAASQLDQRPGHGRARHSDIVLRIEVGAWMLAGIAFAFGMLVGLLLD